MFYNFYSCFVEIKYTRKYFFCFNGCKRCKSCKSTTQTFTDIEFVTCKIVKKRVKAFTK